MTLVESIQLCAEAMKSSSAFYGHGTDNAEDEARWLVLSALDISPQTIELEESLVLSSSQCDQVEELLGARINQRVPTAYLAGEAWFCGLPFYVNEDVLIPRSPIAELIAEKFAPWLVCEPQNILDLCTGSGCIGIATAFAFPDAKVMLTDVSNAALDVCQKNIVLHQLGERVSARESDVFDGLGEETFDLIVSNPPYVSHDEMSALPSEYSHEPDLGLRAGADGLDIVKRIFEAAHRHLNEDGVLVVEVGNSDEAVLAHWPNVEFTWLEFEYGGHGVLLLTKEQLIDIS